jgi:hypothetical protein
MKQDQYGQTRGPGYVVRGDVVPDDDTEVSRAEQPGPMTTRLKKVASAIRGDRPDRTASDQAAAAGQDTGDPNGSRPTRPGEAGAVSSEDREDAMDDGEYADAAGPDDAGAARRPGARKREYWDDEPDEDETVPDEGMAVTNPDAGIDSPAPATRPGDMAAQTRPEGTGVSDPSMTGPDTYGTTASTGTAQAPDPGRGSQADTAAGYGSQAGTAAGYRSQAGTTPGSGPRAGTAPGYGTEAGTATGYGSRAGTATDPQGLTGAGAGATEFGTAEAAAAGRHAAGAADAGLRPGEATDRLGDFGDIAFGNLLPDADQYTVPWQQIQFRFVDDPQGSVTQAADVISQVTAKLEAAIEERKRAIEERQRAIQERASALRGRWGEGSNADTETLRETLRMYRAFMDQLTGSPAS